MKRDMELVRKILLETEQYAKGTGWVNIEIPGYSSEDVSYHVKILGEAGLLAAQDLTTHNGFCWMPRSLTWEGHEFLDAVRNDTVWVKTKNVVKEKGGSVPFEVIKELAVRFAGSLFGLD